MYFWFTAERRDFETHITDQTLLSVLSVRMWSYLTIALTKCKSLTVPLNISDRIKKQTNNTGLLVRNAFYSQITKIYINITINLHEMQVHQLDTCH